MWQMQRKGFRIAVCTVVGLMGAALSRGQSITVNVADLQQTIDMMGGDMERSASAVQNASNTDQIIQWGFEDINFDTCRVQYDKNQEISEGTKNWAIYAKQVLSMQQIKAVNPDIKFFATLRSDYDGFGDENNLPDWICDYDSKDVDAEKYGAFLADYVEYMDQQGVSITYLSIVKEWASFMPAGVADDVIASLQRELSARGVAMPLICDQGFWSISAGINYVNAVTSLGTKDLYWGFCSHDYTGMGLSGWTDLEALSSALGKPLYNDETSSGGHAATAGEELGIASPVAKFAGRCDMYAAGLKGEIFFELWSRGLNNETRPIYFTSGGSGQRLRAYYIIKHFSNNAVDSTYITTETESLTDVKTMAFRKGDQIALWVINKSDTDYADVPISLNGSTLRDYVNDMCWTSNTTIIGESSASFVSGDQFTDTIPAQSLNCYLFDVGPGVNPLSYAESFEIGLGAWKQSVDDDYDWTVNSGETPTTEAGPDGASDGSNYLYAEGHHGLGSYKTASIEATVDFSYVKNAMLSFDYHLYGADIDYLALDVFDGTTWTTNVWIRNGQQHSSSAAAWSSAAVDLSAFTGNADVVLRFRTGNTELHAADPAIDNIRLQGTGGPILAGYDFSDSFEVSEVISPYVSASALTTPMDVGFSTTVGDTSGVDAEGQAFGDTNTLGAVMIAVDDATTSSLVDAVAGDDYFTFTVTPDAQVTMDLDAITFKASKGAEGSVDEYAVTDEAGNLIGSSATITSIGRTMAYEAVSVDLSDNADYQGVTEPVTFRIYAWGRGTTSPWGTASVLDKVTLHGDITFNSTPVAIAQGVETPEDTPVDIMLAGSDIEGDTLTYSVDYGPVNGTLSGTAPNLTYTPDSGYRGADSFTFTVNDSGSTSTPATVSISVLYGDLDTIVYNFEDAAKITDGTYGTASDSYTGADSNTLAGVTASAFSLTDLRNQGTIGDENGTAGATIGGSTRAGTSAAGADATGAQTMSFSVDIPANVIVDLPQISFQYGHHTINDDSSLMWYLKVIEGTTTNEYSRGSV
ncbi:Ig-like domain-containing protein, partial [Pontiellaceae bacterium B1224]|nr:Ig-like domain-containing protein [Pontiellaceae bacterium B1224]